MCDHCYRHVPLRVHLAVGLRSPADKNHRESKDEYVHLLRPPGPTVPCLTLVVGEPQILVPRREQMMGGVLADAADPLTLNSNTTTVRNGNTTTGVVSRSTGGWQWRPMITTGCHIAPPFSLVEELPESYRHYFARLEHGNEDMRISNLCLAPQMTLIGRTSEMDSSMEVPVEDKPLALARGRGGQRVSAAGRSRAR